MSTSINVERFLRASAEISVWNFGRLWSVIWTKNDPQISRETLLWNPERFSAGIRETQLNESSNIYSRDMGRFTLDIWRDFYQERVPKCREITWACECSLQVLGEFFSGYGKLSSMNRERFIPLKNMKKRSYGIQRFTWRDHSQHSEDISSRVAKRMFPPEICGVFFQLFEYFSSGRFGEITPKIKEITD